MGGIAGLYQKQQLAQSVYQPSAVISLQDFADLLAYLESLKGAKK